MTNAMRALAGRFDLHAQTVEDEARKMWTAGINDRAQPDHQP